MSRSPSSLGVVSGAVVARRPRSPPPPRPLRPPPAPVQDFLAGQLADAGRGHPDDRAGARHRHRRRPRRRRRDRDAPGHRVRADRRRRRLGHRRPDRGGARRSRASPTSRATARSSFFDETSNTATRGAEAAATLTGANGQPLDGSGVSVAVIDSGVDPTHPYLQDADGGSAVVANLKSVCLDESTHQHRLRPPGADVLDTDTISGGGHGTHVNGIVAGRPTTLVRRHAAPGRRPRRQPGVDLHRRGAADRRRRLGAELGAREPRRTRAARASRRATCPPIKVTNNSYGPTGGGAFDPNSATVKLQRALAADGVVTVWAAGNDGGDGSASMTNPPGQDPTGGILSVASYYDQDDRHPRRRGQRLLLARRRGRPVDLAGPLRAR